MKIMFAAMFLMIFGGAAVAAEATCKDYTRVAGEDRALFNGFIYGFVMAKIGERGAAEVNTATARVKELVDKFCPAHENDRLAPTIASFVTVVSEYRSEANSPPSPWETHQKCEEQALKATYPKKLDGCADSTCKALSDEWASEALKAKAECVRKKLG